MSGMTRRRAAALTAATLVAALCGGALIAKSPRAQSERPEADRSAGALRPAPERAADDRGRMHDDGCVVDRHTERSPRCVYGDRSSHTTVVLFGDSHAGQYFPPLAVLARRHHWRIVALARMGCPAVIMRYLRGCNEWRRKTVRRIVRHTDPNLIVVSTATRDRIRPIRHGHRVSKRRGRRLVRRGFERMLRRLRSTGARVAVIRDQAEAPFDPPRCVARHRRDLRRCSFRARRSRGHNSYDARAARAVHGVTLIDPLPVLCPEHRCPAVIGDLLVYRNGYHLSATFARSLAPWLDRKLPRPAHESRARRHPRDRER